MVSVLLENQQQNPSLLATTKHTQYQKHKQTMVYEVECAHCGRLLSFGGEDPNENKYSSKTKIPEDAIKFDGSVYCRQCVKKFVEFGTGDVSERIDSIEESLREVREELGFEPEPK